MYVKYIGELFLNMLKGIIIPLVIPSLIATIGSMNIGLSRKVGLRVIAYYLSTTALAVVLGIVLVVSIRPGDIQRPANRTFEGPRKNLTTPDTPDTLMDLLRNCFPPNIIQATIQQYRTVIIYPGEMIVSHSNL